jgi:hypothetical protein
MSLEMMLEIGEYLTAVDARVILSECEVDILNQSGSTGQSFDFEGNFPDSDMPVWFVSDSEPEDVVAEGIVRPSWKRSSTLIFQLMTSQLELCNTQILAFVRLLAKRNPVYFVLSFQFEGVFAINDSRGFREIEDPGSTMQSPAR